MLRRAAPLLSLALMMVLAACGGASAIRTVTASSSTTPVRRVAADPAATATAQAGVLSNLDIGAFPSNFTYRAYDWAPGGNAVAFIGFDRALYIADEPDYTPRRVAPGPASEPRWSPDGALLAFDQQDEGIELVPASGGAAPVRVSPADDTWVNRIIQVFRWLDDRTIAYDVHVGTGSQQLYEMTVDRPADGGLPTSAGTPHLVPLVRTCDECLVAALAFHYSPDGRYIVADYGGWPAVTWYERSTGDDWTVAFPGDPPGATAGQTSLCREFFAWDGDSSGFTYKEAPASSECRETSDLWTYWHTDPRTHKRTQVKMIPQQ